MTPANGAVVGTPSTPVSAVYSDPDGNSGYLAFGVWNYQNQLVWSQWSGLLGMSTRTGPTVLIRVGPTSETGAEL